ncbi:putative sodium-coupled neutral amino acid transporter 10 isoform X1 [Hylaeus volcanicus]|uniref:putative sodium-coupled neutral amino acid transporter 10 isoform X1 n=2 Tax=Hylaeus volcanicus TaxID=313075 RepID=UPI0023B7A461|nr:putative sodium-coupled neutral amino acid transporter 10 isoform X1 [Hylaeus volcanicus]
MSMQIQSVEMISQLSHVMTLANSIIGVSVLAMPFCFKQCGIVLATLVLLVSSVLSRLASHFLIKSAVMSRRRNFELLAFHAFGHMGKVLVELFIIGFLVGTCIAFFVVMGDVGPQIIGKMIDKNPEDIRTSLLVTTSVFIVLPLGLLRNIDSLSSLCTATIIFYLCLVLKTMTESMQHIFAEDWYDHVYYWRPSGILQCIPIFSMALFCQTQLFEIYETIPNVSLEKMNDVVRGALNICTIVYLCVGFFGYIAFCTQPFTGNILMSFEPSLSSEMIKMGFVFSIAFSFPLVIFPCRASLNSLLFRRVHTHEPSISYLPETRFRCLTIAIVAVSLTAGILIPNIEFVLGLVGSTIGVMICLIFPAIFFISISSKHTNERLLAQVILFIAICIMILSTYANLYALEESTNTKALATTSKPLNQINNLPLTVNKDDSNAIANIPKNPDILPDIKEKINQIPVLNILDKSLNLKTNDVRQEPPIPVERVVVAEKLAAGTQKSVESIVITAPPLKIIKNEIVKTGESDTANVKEENHPVELKDKFVDIQKTDNLINSDAIKKEETELAADADAANIMAAERHEKLRKTLEKYKIEQQQMMQEQKEILKDLKELRKLEENEKELKILNQESVLEMKQNSTNLDVNNNKKALNKIKGNNERASSTKLNEQSKTVNNDDKIKIKQARAKEDKSIQTDIQNENSATDVQNKILNNKDFDGEKIKETKVTSSNSKELPKGPILNALSKRGLRKSIATNELVSNSKGGIVLPKNDNNRANNINSNLQKDPSLNTENQPVEHEFSLPIALKMRNQTKVDNASILSTSKLEENIQAIRRDILEDHEREKREIDVNVEETNTKVTSDMSDKNTEYLLKNSTLKDDQEKCFKQNENIIENIASKTIEGLSENPSKSDLVEASLIKTNILLSQQEVNAISVDSNIPIRGEYVKLNQRDLKSVDTDEDCNF